MMQATESGQQATGTAGAVAKVSGLPSEWHEGILGSEQPASTNWLHSGRGLPSRRKRRKRDLQPLESRGSLVRLPFQAAGLSDEDDPDDLYRLLDDDQVAAAADHRPELEEVTAEISEDKWNALVAEKFCGYEAAQAEKIQEVFRSMQDRVCQRLERMWAGAAGTGAAGPQSHVAVSTTTLHHNTIARDGSDSMLVVTGGTEWWGRRVSTQAITNAHSINL